MQTILGSGGAIGIELAKALKSHTRHVRLVSRTPKKVNETDELFPADLTKVGEIKRAIKGSSIVYVTIGFEYKLKVWQEKWPAFMAEVIDVCKVEKAKLVFFDNIYLYDKHAMGQLTEEAPIKPPARKGIIRAQLVDMIMKEVRAGHLTALIARSADFYGPSIQQNSLLTETVFNPLSKGKKANWLISTHFLHSFTYTPDAAKATALLGNTAGAYGQEWHLPTAPPLTGIEWIELIAKALNKPVVFRELSSFFIRLIGLFSPVMKESVEMLYQYDRDYCFSSQKFEQHFNLKPTPPQEAIKHIVDHDYS